jgi:hypothetical protein
VRYTPGPWNVDCRGDIWGVVRPGHVDLIVGRYEEAVGDARLIAAAPDLLEAMPTDIYLDSDGAMYVETRTGEEPWEKWLIRSRAVISRAMP